VYFRPNQAHNGYLQVFLNLGVTGLFFLALTIVAAFRGNARLMRDDFEFGRIRLILLAFALASNYTEATFTRPTEFVWFLFLLVCINPIVSSAEALAPGTVNTRAVDVRVAADPRARFAGRVGAPIRPVHRFRV
jgi:O-antigen ligase